MASTTYLVTGANRGIGLAIVEELSLNKDNFIIATARNPSKATALHDLSSKNCNVKIVAYEGTGTDTEEDKARNAKFAAEISDYTIDILLVNHGIANNTDPMTKVDREDIMRHIRVNAISHIDTVKLVLPYMEKSSVKKIVFISSAAGSMLAASQGIIMPAYGGSKVLLNYFMLQLAAELSPKGFKTATVHPGAVQTDMLTESLSLAGLTTADIAQHYEILTTAKSAHCILTNIVEPLSETNLNKKFVSYEGEVLDF